MILRGMYWECVESVPDYWEMMYNGAYLVLEGEYI